MSKGLIDHCPSAGCGFRCCTKTARVSGVILYPEELKNVSDVEIKHLELGKEYKGGRLAKCKAKDTATCDGGYKPLDCQMYPLLPKFKNGKVSMFKVHSVDKQRSTKCPLAISKLKYHAKLLADKLNKMPNVHDFFNSLPAVGYKKTLEVSK
jgi:hypothetical protein